MPSSAEFARALDDGVAQTAAEVAPGDVHVLASCVREHRGAVFVVTVSGEGQTYETDGYLFHRLPDGQWEHLGNAGGTWDVSSAPWSRSVEDWRRGPGIQYETAGAPNLRAMSRGPTSLRPSALQRPM